MPQVIDWTTVTENGMRAETVDTNTITGPYSLRFESLASQFTPGLEGTRKSSGVFLRDDIYPDGVGMSDGKIRTLFRVDSTDMNAGWGGIFFLSNKRGIGTFADAADDMYQVSVKGGTIVVEKFEFTAPTQIFNTGFAISPTVLYGIEVEWEFSPTPTPCTKIRIQAGTDPGFADLVSIGIVNDTTNPHQFSMSEGLFAQTQSHDDFVAMYFDTT